MRSISNLKTLTLRPLRMLPINNTSKIFTIFRRYRMTENFQFDQINVNCANDSEIFLRTGFQAFSRQIPAFLFDQTMHMKQDNKFYHKDITIRDEKYLFLDVNTVQAPNNHHLVILRTMYRATVHAPLKYIHMQCNTIKKYSLKLILRLAEENCSLLRC
jgi:hypothetical protein